MVKEFFSYEQMQERLPDYIFGRLPSNEKEIFEHSLPNYTDLVNEIENVRKVFAKLDNMNIDRNVSRKTRNIPSKVRAKIQYKQKSLRFFGLPTFRIAVGAIGIVIIALSLFWIKNLHLFPLKKHPESGSVIQTQESSKEVYTEIQYINETEGEKLIADVLKENQIYTIFTESFIDPLSDLGKMEEFNSIVDEILGRYILESLDPNAHKFYLSEPFTFQHTLEQLDNLNENEFQQLLKEVKNVTI